MTGIEQPSTPPPAPPVPPASGGGEPSFGILVQYLKDLSFENFDPVAIFINNQTDEQPKIAIQFDVKIQQIDAERYEVTLVIRATAEIKEKTAYIAEVSYAAVVGMRNIPVEHMGPLLHIEVPRQLFPFVRATIANITREGNYNPLMINSIDLVQLYQRKSEGSAAGVPQESGEGSLA